MISNRLPRHSENRNWYSINAKGVAPGSRTAKVYVYAEIGNSLFGDSITAADFVRDVSGLDVDRIDLHLNSPGGDVYDGIAIANAIRQHPAKVTVWVDGLAASAASFIAVSGDEMVMARNAELMIHDAWGAVLGNSGDMAEMAKRLDAVSNNIASFYAAKAGGKPEDWREAMQAETWYSAEEAVAAGLSDRVDGAADPDVKANFDLSVFAHRGRADAPAPRLPFDKGGPLRASVPHISPPAQPPAEPVLPIPTEGVGSMPDTLTTGLRERLGIPADSDLDEAGLLSALDEALNERTTEPANQTPALPAGIVAVEEAVLTDLRAAAEEGRRARAQQVSELRAAAVEAAISDGRIAPARRQHWIDALAADEGAGDVLASLAKGTVPLAPAGYTGGRDETTDDDRLYSGLFGKDA